ncbi:MAG: FecCD family ABC transporter permease [Parvibaculaceae bacterium]
MSFIRSGKNSFTEERTYALLVAGLALFAFGLFCASLLVGRVPLPWLAGIQDLIAGKSSPAATILLDLRLPRALLGFLVGASLGLGGAAMQGLLRNALAEPGIMGVSGLAACGAVVAFYSGLSGVFALALPLGGIVGALLAVALLYALAGRNGSVFAMLLAGVAINSLAGALTALALNLSPNPYASFEIIFWLMGSLTDRSMGHVILAFPLMLAGWILLASSGPALDALTLGEDTAQSLGFRLGRVRLRLIVGTALAVGASVAVSGAIGFVGLVVPHLLRPIVGYQPSRLLLPSALGGGCLVLAADVAVRLISVGPELKLGILTALVGAPFFLLLIHRLRKEVI